MHAQHLQIVTLTWPALPSACHSRAAFDFVDPAEVPVDRS